MMTLEQARELVPGDFVKVLIPGIGDDFNQYEAGAIGVVEDVSVSGGPQKWIVSVSVEGYIDNSFDAADRPDGLYPLEKVDPKLIFEVKLSGLVDFTDIQRVIADTPEKAVEMVMLRDSNRFDWEAADDRMLPGLVEAYAVTDEDGEEVLNPPQTSAWELANARRLREALQSVLPFVEKRANSSIREAAEAAEALLKEFTSE